MSKPIDHPTVVKQDGLALEHMPEALRTADLCLEAVKQNLDASEHVPHPVMLSALSALTQTTTADTPQAERPRA